MKKRNDQMGTWLGIAACVAGFVLIALGWAQAADAEDVVDQVAPLIGLGLGGLACIGIGVTVIALSARGRDAAAAVTQAEEVAAVLEQLRVALEQRGTEPRPQLRSGGSRQ